MTSMEILSTFLTGFLINKKRNVCYITSPTVFLYKSAAIANSRPLYIDLKENYSPLAPFMQIIKACSPSEETIKENVYSLLQEAFLGYINEGVARERDDIFISDQAFYEKIQCRKSVIRLLKILPPKTYVIINSQYLGKETFEIIKELELSDCQSKFIFSFDQQKTNFARPELYDIFQYLQNKKNFIQFYESSSEDEEVLFPAVEYNEILSNLINLRRFLDTSRSINYCTKTSSLLNTYKLTSAQKRQVYFELGLSYYYAENPDSASLYFNMITSSNDDDDLHIKSLYYLANTYLMRRMNSKAVKYARLALLKMKHNKKSLYHAYAEKTLYNACDRIDTNYLVKQYFEACKCLKNLELWDNYCNTAANVPTCFLEDLNGLKTDILPMLEECAQIEEKLKNEYSLSIICSVMGFSYSRLGDNEKASEYYLKSSSLRTNIGEPKLIIGVKNSLSYEYLIKAQYQLSFELLNTLTEQIIELDDYASVADTLRNITLPLFFSRKFDTANELFNLIIRIIKIFKYDDNASNSYVPEINDLLIYKTVIDIANNDYKHAEFTYQNILNSSNKHYSAILKPFLHYINAAILLNNKEKDKALKYFNDGFKISETSESTDHSNVFIFYEFARLLRDFGFKEESNEYFQKGFEIAHKKGLFFYTDFKENLSLEEFEANVPQFEPLRLNIAYMKSRAEKDKITIDLHDRIIDSQFTNKIMEAAAGNHSIKKYITLILRLIMDYTASDAVFFIEKVENEWNVTSASFNNDKVEPPENYDYYFNLSNSKALVFDKISNSYFSNLSKFKFQSGIVIIPPKKNSLSLENLEALNLAFTNIQNEIIMKKQQETLVLASTIDPLTKLYNRGTLFEHLEEYSEKIRRNFKKKNTKHQITVCFIDLDNFKYYNDTFSHRIGDFLLKRFAEVLMSNYRRVDCLARFGGDEFIVVLPETNCENAQILAERLFKAIENRQHFIPELEAFMNKKLNISRKHYLSFSMGICSNFEIEDPSDLKTVTKHADDALYYSKEQGKHRYTIWSKDEIES